MDSDRSSPLGQDVDVPASVHANFGDEEIPATNLDIGSSTTNGHVDTSLKKRSEDLIPDGIKIEFNSEGAKERAEERPVAHTVQTDGRDGLRDVPLSDDKLNGDTQTTDALNGHPAPSDHVPNHDTSRQESVSRASS